MYRPRLGCLSQIQNWFWSKLKGSHGFSAIKLWVFWPEQKLVLVRNKISFHSYKGLVSWLELNLVLV